ncbi:MAG: glutamate--tRNA ligase [Candidatus Nomurabacteria bacterium]|jgi:glutamyl-tRNA synthetase|nr:glutamate--tRNA ligase [Candidatus Nomurabacteria bacterium]
MKQIRTRFAPSPTGFLHVGSIHTALFDYLLAKQSGGQFILRSEDTDRARFVDAAENHIMDSLKALEINYDEGPDKAGPYGPYRQSERLKLYKVWAEKLVKSGRAYADPYTPEQVQEFRKQAENEQKPFLFRNHRPAKPPTWDGTQPLRFKSEPKKYTWQDAVMGQLSAGAEAIDDFIIMKSDGYPTYNFAHIVDDFEMKITHVLRGQEFIASTPNYLNLYEALEIDRPIFATMPPILAPAGNRKLSKRDGAQDVLEYLRDGYLPEALVNFLAKIGWNDGTEQEIYAMDELIKKFSLERIPRAGARFDDKKLLWLNGQWIKKLSVAELAKRCQDFWGEVGKEAKEAEQLEVLAVVQDRLKTLKDLPALSEYFFATPTLDLKMLENDKQLKKISRTEQVEMLEKTIAKLETTDWEIAKIQSSLNELLEITDSKPMILFSLIRYCLTWAAFSPALPETMALLGKNQTISRLKTAASFRA